MKKIINLKEKFGSTFFAGTVLGLIFGIFGFFISFLAEDETFKNGAFVGYVIISIILYIAFGIGLVYLIRSVS